MSQVIAEIVRAAHQRLVLCLAASCCLLAPAMEAQEPAPDALSPAAIEPLDTADDESWRSQAENKASIADGMFRRGWYEMAAREYLELIKKYPKFEGLPRAYFNWAESLRYEQEIDQALTVYNQLRHRFPSHKLSHQAIVNVMSLRLDKDDPEGTLKLLQEAKPEEMAQPVREALHYHAGVAYSKTGNTDAAKREFTKVATLPLGDDPRFRIYARLSLAYIHRHLGELEAAERFFEELSDFADTPMKLRQEVMFRLASLATLQKADEKAVTRYRTLIDRYSAGDFTDQARINLGWTLLRLGERSQEIIELFQDAKQQGPDALYLQGVSCKHLKRYEPALAFYDRLAAFGKSEYYEFAEFDAVECLYHLDRHELCIERARSFVNDYPHHKQTANVFYFMGQSYAALDQLPEAATAFETALERFWGKWQYQEDAVMILADIYIRSRELKKAAATYRRVMKIPASKRHFEALYAAAECAIHADNHAQAFKDLNLLYETFEDHEKAPEVLLQMAELKIQIGEPEKAINILDRFLEKYPEHELVPRARYRRGSEHYRQGRTIEAIRDFRLCVGVPTFNERNLARLFLGYALWETNQEGEALTIFTDLLQSEELVGDFVPELLAQIGGRYMELNNFASAETAYTLLAQSDESGDRLAGSLGLGKLAFQRQQWDRAYDQFKLIRDQTDKTSHFHATAIAYLGEILRQLGREDEAFIVLKDAIDMKIQDLRASTIAYLAIARLYYKRDKLKAAMSHACFVWFRCDDQVYTPLSMLFTIEMLLSDNAQEKAMMTYKELASRYPLVLRTYQSDPQHAELFAKLKDIESAPEP